MVQTALREGISEAARQHRCARSTVQRLVRRHEEGGLWALCNQPRGPRQPIAEEIRELIVELKVVQPRRSCDKIRRLMEELGYPVCRQTVWRALSERGLARVQEREPLRRFVHPQPNDLWQLDLMEDESTAVGKVHLVAALDDHSRFCVGAKFVRRKGEVQVLGVLAELLGRWGLPAAVLTDRAVMFFGTRELPSGTTTYQMALDALGVRAAFAAPYKPRTKGKVEKFFSFVQRDFLEEVRTRCALWMISMEGSGNGCSGTTTNALMPPWQKARPLDTTEPAAVALRRTWIRCWRWSNLDGSAATAISPSEASAFPSHQSTWGSASGSGYSETT